MSLAQDSGPSANSIGCQVRSRREGVCVRMPVVAQVAMVTTTHGMLHQRTVRACQPHLDLLKKHHQNELIDVRPVLDQ